MADQIKKRVEEVTESLKHEDEDFIDMQKRALYETIKHSVEERKRGNANNDLMRVSPSSVAYSVQQATDLGLVVGSRYKECYLTPYGSEATLTLDYKGHIKIAMDSGVVEKEMAAVVHENDEFELDQMNPDNSYHKVARGNRGERQGVWAKAWLSRGGTMVRYLDKEQVKKVKEMAKTQSIWDAHTSEMWRKTAVRNLNKYIPLPPKIKGRLSEIEEKEFDTEIDSEEGETEEEEVPSSGVDRLKEKTEDSEQEDEEEQEEEEDIDYKAYCWDLAQDLGVTKDQYPILKKKAEQDGSVNWPHMKNKLEKMRDDEEYREKVITALKSRTGNEKDDEQQQEDDKDYGTPDEWGHPVEEYHYGAGNYHFPDGENVKGKQDARDYLEKNDPANSSDEKSKEEMKDEFEEMEEERIEEEDNEEDQEVPDDPSCVECGDDIPETLAEHTIEQYGDPYCMTCGNELK